MQSRDHVREGRGGLPQSDALAVEWYRKAADQGYAQAQYNLGGMYEEGRGGLPQSDALAVEWYRKAADQGYAGGAVASESRRWMYRKAADQGMHGSGARASELDRGAPVASQSAAQGHEQAAGAIELSRGAAGATPTAARLRAGAAAIEAVLQMQRQPRSTISIGLLILFPSSSPIPIGTRVELHGLKAKKLNRQRGVVAGFDADSGRCVVKLEDGREQCQPPDEFKKRAASSSYRSGSRRPSAPSAHCAIAAIALSTAMSTSGKRWPVGPSLTSREMKRAFQGYTHPTAKVKTAMILNASSASILSRE